MLHTNAPYHHAILYCKKYLISSLDCIVYTAIYIFFLFQVRVTELNDRAVIIILIPIVCLQPSIITFILQYYSHRSRFLKKNIYIPYNINNRRLK